MKIIGIGRNYSDHARELNNEVPEEPIVFIKPDTALLRDNAPFYYPSFTKKVHYEVELVLRISREGKNIEEQFAYKYFDELGIGIDFTARDLQDVAKSKGLPWALAKGFNGSAPVSEFLPVASFPDLKDIFFNLKVNGIVKQEGNSGQMLHSFLKIISYVSGYMTLKKGDLLFTGTPAGVGEVHIGDVLQAYIGDRQMMHFEIR
jgi:acylpyruvate hydrolase